MASAFERAHGEQLLGALTTVDGLIVHGHLSRLSVALAPQDVGVVLANAGVVFHDGDCPPTTWRTSSTGSVCTSRTTPGSS